MREHVTSALAALAIAAAAQPVAAGDPPPFKEFTFKRIGAPPKSEPSGSKRITIQIDPTVDPWANPVAPEKDEADVAEAPSLDLPGVYGAFWGAMSPSLAEASPARLEAALNALDGEGSPSGPRLDDMRKITDRYGRDILRYTVNTRVSPALVAAIISVESSGQPQAVSSAGATGLMQLMPATAERFGVTDLTEPSESIKGGVAYLDWLMGEFDHDPLMILAGYNAGEGAVRSHGGVPPYEETRAYVPKVLAAWKVASGLCQTPPQLISDGCVFMGGS